MSDLVAAIAEQGVIPVVRARDTDDAVATARALHRGGMRIVELTRSTPRVEEALTALRADGIVLGLGTIATAAEVAPAVAAGARFVVSYARPSGFVEAARDHGVPAFPGVFTPQEAASALAAGAPALKLFPARLAQPAYLRDLRAVLPGVPVMASGGIGTAPEQLLPWLRAGAAAVGVGSDLGTVAEVGTDEVERRARAVLATRRLVERA
jgi:2-dehydro-3-deoxyphosphogluconate aldolase / (4S)-4-hydroxy-2-oxoglutarate aldolase